MSLVMKGVRIILREITESDLDLVMEWRNRPEVMNCFFSRTMLTAEGQRKWFASYQVDDTDVMLMIVTHDGIPIGTMALYHIDNANRKAEFGRVLLADERFSGKGFAYEALELILAYAFKRLMLNRLYLEVFANNESAIRLYEKCGFIREGLLREDYSNGQEYLDVTLMSILKRDYDLSKK